MRILLVHNFYQQAGGEDVVFRAELSMLSASEHDVEPYTVSNDDVNQYSKIGLAARSIWNAQSAAAIADKVRSGGFDLVHFHNTFPLLSPAVYGAVRAAGAATVQTLHNYRLMCANALFFRDGHVCEACLGHAPLPAITHRCYRNSLGASVAVAAMQVTHRARGTYQHDVDAFITLTEFSRSKFVEGGLPADRLHVKPNFLDPDPGVGRGGGGYALYIGRLSPEKGILTVLEAWKAMNGDLPLVILGDGPLRGEVERAVQTTPGITYMGQRGRAEVLDVASRAEALIVPSECYENFPMTIVEAFAVGLPVVASRIGAMQHIVTPGRTGALFTPGDPADLVEQVHTFMAADRGAARIHARAEYEQHYTSEQNLKHLLYIYDQAKQVHMRQR